MNLIQKTSTLYIKISIKILNFLRKKVRKTIKDKKIKEVSFFEIEDKFFEKRIFDLLKKTH